MPEPIRLALFATIALCLALAPVLAQEDGFVSLSDDPELSGWHISGADSWDWQDGALHCSGEGSGWLRSDRVYGDFVLRFDYKIAENGNSGVWIHAPLRGRASASGFEYQILGRPADTNSTGSHAALYDIKPPDSDATKATGEWNATEITCQGSLVKVTLNGTVIHDVDFEDAALNDAMLPGWKPRERLRRGYIGLTNHGAEVFYRNMAIRELPEEGFEPLIVGDFPQGWESDGKGAWRIEDGALIGAGTDEALLATQAEYDSYVLRLRYRPTDGTRAGIHLRRNPANTRSRIEIILAGDTSGPTSQSPGALRGYAVPHANVALPAGEWNDLEVVYDGFNLRTTLNGVPLLDDSIFRYSGFYRPPEAGSIALSCASGQIEISEIRVKRLGE